MDLTTSFVVLPLASMGLPLERESLWRGVLAILLVGLSCCVRDCDMTDVHGRIVELLLKESL
jgi:hypothetical protein